MGSGFFRTTASSVRSQHRATTGTTAFNYDSDIKSGKAPKKCHETLDLTLKPIRECRDNDTNPLAIPIAIMIDVTGSMGKISHLIIQDLHKVVEVIRDKGAVKYPSLCFGAVGDANCDAVPIQMGEFESDDVLSEQHLSNIFLEGNGGGNYGESYDLPLWFFNNKVTTDHWEKRGSKGFLFVIGDEGFFPEVKAEFVNKYCGGILESDQDIHEVVNELLEKWEVFVIRPGGTANFESSSIRNSWVELFGSERVFDVDDWQEINSLIAGTISVISGVNASKAVKDLTDTGLKVSDSTSSALISLENIKTISNMSVDNDSNPVSRC